MEEEKTTTKIICLVDLKLSYCNNLTIASITNRNTFEYSILKKPQVVLLIMILNFFDLNELQLTTVRIIDKK